MTNEQIVQQIQNGSDVTDNMRMLYEQNLPLIRKIVKPYTTYEDMEDLLQEAYFGLLQAVQHYKMGENTLFMTYALYTKMWLCNSYIGWCYMESKTLQENGSESITGIKKKSNKKRNCCTYGNYVGRS